MEVFHPQLSQVYRFVTAYKDMNFILEPNAPRDAGQSVLFDAVTLSIKEPSERNDSEQNLAVTFGNVDGRIHDIVDQISGQGFFIPIDLIYRKYYSGDLAGPVTSPLKLFISFLAFDGPEVVTFTAEDIDLSAKRSGSVYELEKFPGLKE